MTEKYQGAQITQHLLDHSKNSGLYSESKWEAMGVLNQSGLLFNRISLVAVLRRDQKSSKTEIDQLGGNGHNLGKRQWLDQGDR